MAEAALARVPHLRQWADWFSGCETPPHRGKPSEQNQESIPHSNLRRLRHVPALVAQVHILRKGQFLVAGQLFHVDVFEGDHPHALDETGGAVDIPHPGVLEREVKVDFAVGAARLQVHMVGKIETPFGLDYVAEQPDDVTVFAVELQLHVGFIVLKILGTHGSILHYSARHRGQVREHRSENLPADPVVGRGPCGLEGLFV